MIWKLSGRKRMGEEKDKVYIDKGRLYFTLFSHFLLFS